MIMTTNLLRVAQYVCMNFFAFFADLLMSLKTVTQCGDDETSCLSNKLGELSLATFDESGLCIGPPPGSWAFAQ